MVNTDKIHQDLHRYFWDANTEQPLTELNYQIDSQGSVHVRDADIQGYRVHASRKLPVQFGVVDGDFVIENLELTTLMGAPTKVGGRFSCSKNALMSLMYAPTSCVDLDCSHNQLVTLKHAPRVINSISCDNNQLRDLTACPPAQEVFAAYNPFEHFRNTPGDIERVTLTYKPNLPLLGLLSVHHVEIFDPDNGEYMEPLSKILNAHVGKGVTNKVAMLKCAGELIKAGYKGNARW